MMAFITGLGLKAKLYGAAIISAIVAFFALWLKLQLVEKANLQMKLEKQKHKVAVHEHLEQVNKEARAKSMEDYNAYKKELETKHGTAATRRFHDLN